MSMQGPGNEPPRLSQWDPARPVRRTGRSRVGWGLLGVLVIGAAAAVAGAVVVFGIVGATSMSEHRGHAPMMQRPPAAALAPAPVLPPVDGLSYTNIRVSRQPWSIHVVQMDRSKPDLHLLSAHAGGRALGLGTLSSQVRLRAAGGTPLAGVNGDFYQRDRSFAGDPRGLQVVDGEVISGPSGGTAFWIDGAGQPGLASVASRFEVTWPDGRRSPFDVNSDREWNGLLLYTPAAGSSTRTGRGREWILERTKESPEFPLRLGVTYPMRVRAVRETGETPIEADTWVLSAGPGLARSLPEVEAGALVTISTATTPDLSGVRQAIGGGPALVRGGKPVRLGGADSDTYESSSMWERHPRSAVGWNGTHYFLVQVDGRQWGLSVGMTLEELGEWMARLGCEQAMTLDGGGSATLWYQGAVRNSPCDGRERPIANSLVVVRRPAGGKVAGGSPSGTAAAPGGG